MGFPNVVKTAAVKGNYFQKLTITWSSFNGNPDGYGADLIIPFSTQGFILLNEDATAVIEVSYDGVNVHDELNGATSTKGIAYDNRVNSIFWFRLKSGSSAIVSLRAWAIR